MLITRKIGKLLRGKASPPQVMAACVLGSLIGFVPGFWQGPGLTLVLVFLLIVLNANLFLAALVGGAAKLLSLAVMPASFMVGRALLDGPLQGLFRWIVNTPGLALLGLEHYATTGGVVTGLVFGVLVGVVIVRALRLYWKRMASLEEGSERYKRFASKWWVRAINFVFIGGKPKQAYAELAQKQKVKIIRPLGVVFVLLLGALLTIAHFFLSDQIVTTALQRGLERANGATVDVGNASLDLREGRMTVTDLAMADPKALDTDVFRAARLEARVSTADLLRKRIAMDRVVAHDAAQGAQRRFPGRTVGRPPRPAPPPPTREGEKTIEDYVRDAEEIKERLAQVRRWLERLGGEGDEEEAPDRETLRERLERQVRERGYARVAATHLIEDSPTFLVREMEIFGLRTEQLGDELVDVQAWNISTHPRLVEGSPRVSVKSRQQTLEADVALALGRADDDGKVLFALRGLSGDAIGRRLAFVGEPPLRGGTVDLVLDGFWTRDGVGHLDLPLSVTVNNGTIFVPGAGEAQVERFVLPLGLRGPMDNPAVMLDEQRLADALMQAGAAELSRRVRAEADRAIDKATGELEDRVGEGVRDALRGLGGRRDRDDEKKEDDPG